MIEDLTALSSLPPVTLPTTTDAIIPQSTAALFNLPLASLVAGPPPPTHMVSNLNNMAENLDMTQGAADNLEQDIETLQDNIAALQDALGIQFDQLQTEDGHPMDLDAFLQAHDFQGTEEERNALLNLLQGNPIGGEFPSIKHEGDDELGMGGPILTPLQEPHDDFDKFIESP